MTKRISSGAQIIAAEILFIVSDEKHGLSALSKSAPPTKQRHAAARYMGGWLRDNIDYGERTAQNLMGLSANIHQIRRRLRI